MEIFSFVDGITAVTAIIFIIGLILLIVEMFIPGFGIAGGTGVVLIIIGIVLTARTPLEAFVMFLILVVFVALALTVIFRSAKQGKLARKLILWSSAKREDGFSTSSDTSSLVGKEGISLTILRPAGSGLFDSQRLDVVTEGTFIEKGTKIRVIRTEGRRIVVEPVQ